MNERNESNTLWPEKVTDEQLRTTLPVIEAFVFRWAADGKRLHDEAVTAFERDDRAGAESALCQAIEMRDMQKRWAKRLGKGRTSEKHKAVMTAFDKLCSNIQRALDGELGNNDPADWWKYADDEEREKEQ